MRGEAIEVDSHVMVCAECGEELFNEELDSETFKKSGGNSRELVPEMKARK